MRNPSKNLNKTMMICRTRLWSDYPRPKACDQLDQLYGNNYNMNACDATYGRSIWKSYLPILVQMKWTAQKDSYAKAFKWKVAVTSGRHMIVRDLISYRDGRPTQYGIPSWPLYTLLWQCMYTESNVEIIGCPYDIMFMGQEKIWRWHFRERKIWSILSYPFLAP